MGGHWVAKGDGHEQGGRVYGRRGEGGRTNRKEEDRKEMLTKECRLTSVEKIKFNGGSRKILSKYLWN